MSTIPWFGYQAQQKAIMAWGARAIFHPHWKDPLDLLVDRQGRKYEEQDQERFYAFVDFINQHVLPVVREISTHFSTSDSDKFTWRFDWPADSELLVVAEGSPNASYGYFYLAVNLMRREDAPEERRPRGYLTAEEKEQAAARRRERQQEIDATAARFEAEARQHRQSKRKKAQKEIDQRNIRSADKKPGEPLEVGDHIWVEINQAERHAFVQAVAGDEALVEYFMPAGKKFLKIVSVETHAPLRSVTAGKIPKRFQLQSAS